MDKKIVGANAGKVWHALNEADGISIPELARKSKPECGKYGSGSRLAGS